MTDGEQKIPDHLRAVLAVDHLGMELHPPNPALAVLECGRGRVPREGRFHKTLRRVDDMVAVAHPADGFSGHALKK